MTSVVLLLLGLVTGAVLARLYGGWRRERAARRALRDTVPPGPEAMGTPRRPSTSLAVLREAELPRDQRPLALEQAGALRPYLRDLALQHGADQVLLWRRGRRDAALRQVVALDEGAAWTPSPGDLALIEWASSEGVVVFDRSDGVPRLVASPVPFEGEEAAGALVLWAEQGLGTARSELKSWMPRHAERTGQMVQWQLTRDEVAQQNKRIRSLLRTAQDLQSIRTGDELAQAVCRSALAVASAQLAALVRWDAAREEGSVAGTAGAWPATAHAVVIREDSLVGDACLEGASRLWAEARDVRDRVVAPGVVIPCGSLTIVPLRLEGRVIGALVVGTEEERALVQFDMRNLGLLGTIAVSSLEAVWELEEVARRARTDQLTGLANRRHFEEQLQRVLNEADRFAAPCTLVMLDLDHFKSVNDTHGHDVGDQVLQSVASVLRETVRTVDIAARLGGEELAVLLPQTEIGGGIELAERLRQRIEARMLRLPTGELRFTASFGVAAYPAPGGGGRDGLYKRADRALYAAKRAGRNRVDVDR